MHKELKTAINDVAAPIKFKALSQLSYELLDEEVERFLAKAKRTKFELQTEDFQAFIDDVLGNESDSLTIEHVRNAVVGIDAVLSIIQCSKPYQQMISSRDYVNFGNADITRIINELKRLHVSITDYETEIELGKIKPQKAS